MYETEHHFFKIIHSRKSVRNFTGRNVEVELLKKIIKAGMAAPTAVNQQPWDFIAISDRTILDKLADGLPYAKMLYTAGAAIIVCSDASKAYNSSNDFAIIDASLASQNILLAIEALGLGGLWTAVYPDKVKMDFVSEILNIPQNIIPLNVIPVGYPTGEDMPKNKFKEESIHFNKW